MEHADLLITVGAGSLPVGLLGNRLENGEAGNQHQQRSLPMFSSTTAPCPLPGDAELVISRLNEELEKAPSLLLMRKRPMRK